MTTDEKIAVLQAYKAGKQIELKTKPIARCLEGVIQYTDWTKKENPIFNFGLYDYRVKPEPREFWLRVYEDADVAGFAYTRREKDRGRIPPDDERPLIHVREVI